MSIIYTALSAVILLGMCIFVHELGHLLGGKIVGIKAKVFSMGYGKGFIKKKWGDTTYQITLIPFGGYCSFYGENASEKLEGKGYEFLTASPWRRIVTVISGPLFNLFFGIILFFIMNLVGYKVITNRISIPDILKQQNITSQAYESGLRTGDRIVEINGEKTSSFEDIYSSIIFSDGQSLNIKYERDNKELTAEVQPKKSGSGYYSIGLWYLAEYPMLSFVQEKKAADKAGLKIFDIITKVNGEKINSDKKFSDLIKSNPGKILNLTVKRKNKIIEIPVKPQESTVLNAYNLQKEGYSDIIKELQIMDSALIPEAIKNGNVKINSETPKNFDEFNKLIEGEEKLTLEIPGGKYTGEFKYKKIGLLGVGLDMAPVEETVQYSKLSNAVKYAFIQPAKFIKTQLKFMGLAIRGKINVKDSVGGPIKIAKIAGDTAKYKGNKAFAILMAQISIILMVMNLLPIPAVDGSFILIFLFEAITRKKVNEKFMYGFQTIGVLVLITLFILITYNDITGFLK